MAVNPENMTRKMLSLPHNLAREIEDFRFDARINAESEAMRVLMRLGLEVHRERKRRDGQERQAAA